MNTPNLENFGERFPPPAYLEGYYDLPEGSLCGDESLDVSMGKMPKDVYMGYLGQALSLKRKRVTKFDDGNESLNSRPSPVTKFDDGNESIDSRPVLCACGCGEPVSLSATGRPAKFASGACRVRYHRKKKGA